MWPWSFSFLGAYIQMIQKICPLQLSSGSWGLCTNSFEYLAKFVTLCGSLGHIQIQACWEWNWYWFFHTASTELLMKFLEPHSSEDLSKAFTDSFKGQNGRNAAWKVTLLSSCYWVLWKSRAPETSVLSSLNYWLLKIFILKAGSHAISNRITNNFS